MRGIIAIGIIILSYIMFPIFTMQLLQLLLLLIVISIGFYLLYKISIQIIAIGIGVSGVIMAVGLISYALYILG
ncbi:hypothetical protein HWX41_27360 [Bacillus paramycoides]|uniref:hypothetical protein n=1 Tax=Bacillus paramycoides TaxID=2026194 RepID=UPI0015BF5D27|nr:hypothetical protein [Bacillus paramycoides]NWK72642.1 hypothetical protein [Bacillus paramycoides]